MSKNLLALTLILLIALASTENINIHNTPVTVEEGKKITLFDVWPHIDNLLKTNYWYYLRGADTVYQAAVDSPNKYLYFVIYRNIVGTFLVINTWTKADQKTQVNTFVRLGNGYDSRNGSLYQPVDISPFIVTLELKPDEYMVTIDENGKITVTGNKDLFDEIMGNLADGAANGGGANGFSLTDDMKEKCAIVDKDVREKYWYYLRGADKLEESNVPTTKQYYCIFVYVNVVGTFLAITHYDLETKTTGVNTLVRLGNGKAEGANYGPVELNPAILELKQFK